jgi:hypothetical protein
MICHRCLHRRSTFLLEAFVRRVNRRIDIRMVRF